MARMIRTSHAKNNAIPGMAYPLMVLVLATTASYPPMPDIIDRLTDACGAGGPAVRGGAVYGELIVLSCGELAAELLRSRRARGAPASPAAGHQLGKSRQRKSLRFQGIASGR